MKSEIAFLIISLALEIGVDERLAFAVVEKENAYFEDAVVGVTGDLGIMQLNPKYIDWFVETYWQKAEIFDWRNPDHNIYIGLRHLKYLLSLADFSEWQAIAAYNCGEYAVRRGRLPDASIDYANAVYAAWRENK